MPPKKPSEMFSRISKQNPPDIHSENLPVNYLQNLSGIFKKLLKQFEFSEISIEYSSENYFRNWIPWGNHPKCAAGIFPKPFKKPSSDCFGNSSGV